MVGRHPGLTARIRTPGRPVQCRDLATHRRGHTWCTARHAPRRGRSFSESPAPRICGTHANEERLFDLLPDRLAPVEVQWTAHWRTRGRSRRPGPPRRHGLDELEHLSRLSDYRQVSAEGVGQSIGSTTGSVGRATDPPALRSCWLVPVESLLQRVGSLPAYSHAAREKNI